MGDEPLDSTDTELLLREVQIGDHVALNRLLEMHREEVHRLVSRKLNKSIRARTDASDIVQETLMEVAERLPEYIERSPMPFRVWLRCTALEKLRDANRRHYASGRSVLREQGQDGESGPPLEQNLPAGDSSPSGRLKKQELLAALSTGIEELSEADQEIVLMRWVENLPYNEIGLVIGITPATARQRHGRALARLGSILAKQQFKQKHQ